jgi:hypothetical protein
MVLQLQQALTGVSDSNAAEPALLPKEASTAI